MKGTGRNGMLLKGDVLQFIANQQVGGVRQQPSPVHQEPSTHQLSLAKDVAPTTSPTTANVVQRIRSRRDTPPEAIALSATDLLIAREYTDSKINKPHFYVSKSCQIDNVLNIIEREKNLQKSDAKREWPRKAVRVGVKPTFCRRCAVIERFCLKSNSLWLACIANVGRQTGNCKCKGWREVFGARRCQRTLPALAWQNSTI
jgi:pyruvate/2-oxoglutarate dehydrogenase complex dihydrolipoamide acyltransferase (E2) component